MSEGLACFVAALLLALSIHNIHLVRQNNRFRRWARELERPKPPESPEARATRLEIAAEARKRAVSWAAGGHYSDAQRCFDVAIEFERER